MPCDEAHPNASIASTYTLSPSILQLLPTPYPFQLMRFTSYYYPLLFLLLACSPAVSALDTSARPLTGCPTAPFTPKIVATEEEANLKVVVPNITSFRQFVNCSNPPNVRGFCIDVFEKALSILPPPLLRSTLPIHYTCFNFSSTPGPTGSTYDDMVDSVANGTYDAVVGDTTIGAHRLSLVDFTHKYMESGMVITEKLTGKEVSPWLFFEWPFSWRLWCTIVGAFAFTSFLICYLEKDDHPEFTQGHITQRLSNLVWFSTEALVLLERESLKSASARGVMLAWLFFVVLLGASYTAGLSSFLTTNNLSSHVQDLQSLRDSGQKIGFRRGSIVKDYLTQRFQIPEHNLVALRMVPEFVNNLNTGGVVAIVDELPYANFILSALSSSSCDYGYAGSQLTQEGFGFGFNKERQLEHAFSIALMNLTESGCLQELEDKYGMGITSNCSTSNVPSNQVPWKSSFLLFIILLGFLVLCVMMHYVNKYVKKLRSHQNGNEHVLDDSTICIHSGMTHRHPHVEVELLQYPY